jgi:NAD+ diphosphatase
VCKTTLISQMPDTSELPFNNAILGGDFQLGKLGSERPEAKGYWLPLQGRSLIVQSAGGRQRLLAGELPFWASGAGEPSFVGSWKGQPLWALEVAKGIEIPESCTVEPFHGVEATLDERLSTLAGLAHQMLHWERQSRFCSCCATALQPIAGTWGKRCPGCSSEHYPHIHPCIIVLVRRGDEFLLVRNALWPPERFSLVAGFLDLGESLEECVQREVREEAGIEVDNIRYVGSQNWPFPSQQMIGFLADYASGEVRPDGIEVVDARWFTNETLPHYPGSTRSISRWILNHYARLEPVRD